MTKINHSADGLSTASPKSIIERKMTPFETYIALVKGYCCILILILPKSFANGGYVASSILLIISGLITSAAATMLVESGLKTNIYSYPRLVEKAFGSTGKFLVDIMITLAQFSFSVSHIAFIIESLMSVIDNLFEIESSFIPYMILVLCVMVPIAWVNNIAVFAFTYMLGNLLILLTALVVSSYCGLLLTRN